MEILFAGVVFTAVITYILYRLVRYRGFLGAQFGAEIRRTVGELESAVVGPMRTVLRIYVLASESAPDKNVGLEFVEQNDPKITPIALSRAEVAYLILLLQQASHDCNAP